MSSAAAVFLTSARTGDGSYEWETPDETFADYDRRFGPFTLDASATAENSKCPYYLGRNPASPIETLQKDWVAIARDAARNLGTLRPGVWLNPRYSPAEQPCAASCDKKRCERRGRHCLVYEPGLKEFVYKAAKTAEEVRVGCYLPARTDSTWWHGLVVPILERRAPGVVEFKKGRERFIGVGQHGATFASVFVFFKPPHEE